MNSTKNPHFFLAATVSCQIYLVNLAQNEFLCKFDMEQYRASQNLGTNALNNTTAQNQANMCFFVQPYSEFDIQTNPLVLVMD